MKKEGCTKGAKKKSLSLLKNEKYYVALKSAIEKTHREGKKANVLDIGTGTGLLSMMAAKCGADTITACEVNYFFKFFFVNVDEKFILFFKIINVGF